MKKAFQAQNGDKCKRIIRDLNVLGIIFNICG